MIPRYITQKILSLLKPQQVVGLFGARRTGKTKIMEYIKEQLEKRKKGKGLLVQGDNMEIAELLASRKTSVLKDVCGDHEFLFIDEAQKIPHIGESLKLIVDHIKGIKVFISGSSSLDLKQKTGEPLTGRSIYLHLYPIAQIELIMLYMTITKNAMKVDKQNKVMMTSCLRLSGSISGFMIDGGIGLCERMKYLVT
ncbi:MAG: AAA family ATPase [Bacteroidota bacterium]